MRKVVVAVTGASGSVYASLLIEKLLSIRSQWNTVSLVMTKNARMVWETELGNQSYQDIALDTFENDDFSAPFASGSARYDTMILIPCSMGCLGRIATGVSSDLISRSADVILKERRKLICVIRDTPYNLIHIRNMETITLAGGIICPASPSFYSNPATIEAVASTVVDRVIDLAGFDLKSFRWGKNQQD